MIELSTINVLRGDTIQLSISSTVAHEYHQVQIEVFDTCIPNPKSLYGFGIIPEIITTEGCIINLDTKTLAPGIYEVKIIILHTPKDESNSRPQLQYIGGVDYERMFFRITETKDYKSSQEELRSEVFSSESDIEKNFINGFDLGGDEHYSVFALIKGLKIGVRYRMDRFEFLPLPFGLQSTDELSATNYFLSSQTKTGLYFEYGDNVDQISQQNLPVSVAHFPLIKCNDENQAIEHVSKLSALFLESMSLIRGASGEIYDIIVIDRKDGHATRHTIQSLTYRGNLLTGWLTGENPEKLQQFMDSLESNGFLRFLVKLHKEALQEDNIDYQFLRLWTILEYLAESKNYDTGRTQTSLQDANGDPLFELENGNLVIDPKTGQPRVVTVKNSIAQTYQLYIDHQYGDPRSNVEKLQTWLALRDSVAHFGSISHAKHLSNADARNRASQALNTIQSSNGHNSFLWELEEDVKLLLMRELIANTHNNNDSN